MKMAWMPKDDLGEALASTWKEFDGDLYVEVSIVRSPDGFVVRSLAESRTSGPNETLSAPFVSFEAAAKEAERLMAYWDNEEAAIDLTMLKIF